MRILRWYVRIARDAFDHFLAADGWAIASHIALSTLMGLFPFLIVVTALAGFVGSKNLADQAAQLLLQAWPPEVSQPIAREIHYVLTVTRGDVLTLGVAFSVYFASSGVESLRIGLNRAYRVGEKRPWWLLRLESIVYVVVGAVALLAMALLVVLAPLILSKAAKYVPWMPEPYSFGSIFVRYAMASAILIVALTLVHLWLPAGLRRMRDIAPGILATLLLWLGSGALFGRYLAEFASNYVSMYAGLASVMIALIYLYVNAAIFIYGGELNAAIMRMRALSGR
ncbi:MAG TPA: YihY/virulence factor BrkB family protein [Xanthobacteraceae bacterium]|nr:YihY/virulence factor BrkB family protein [Xanthobacteraceae bacterium]